MSKYRFKDPLIVVQTVLAESLIVQLSKLVPSDPKSRSSFTLSISGISVNIIVEDLSFPARFANVMLS